MEKGKKMALVVGCNYPGTKYELRGCHNDALAMRMVLITRFGFDPKDVELLTDKPCSPIIPTGANIKSALNKMVDVAKPGDVLFFHYSGHGTTLNYSFKRKEAIVPSDFNLITSVDFREIVNRIPKGATFTILSDSCHSGGLIDKEKEQVGPDATPDRTISSRGRLIDKEKEQVGPDASPDGTIGTPAMTSYKPKEIPFQSILQHFTSLTSKVSTDIGTHLLEVFGQDASLMFQNKHEQVSKPLKADQGILLSGCQTNETSADVDGKKPCGAFSNAVQVVLKENTGALSNREVVVMARKVLSLQSFINQHPCLYCSDENAEAVFLGSLTKENVI